MNRSARVTVGDAPPDDDELIRRVVAGERSAFEEIYRRHADHVFALLTRLVGPDREREDLLQDVFIRLHPALSRFRGDCSLGTLVFRIATRVAMDRLRHLRRARTELVDFDLEDEIDPAATPAEVTERVEQLTEALAQLAQLAPKLRIAFVLREVMGMSYQEVARIADTNAAAARMRVALARRALAKLGRSS
ncbi:MAG: RNA polymerase sigma factor [Kofleriaceae bacterium]